MRDISRLRRRHGLNGQRSVGRHSKEFREPRLHQADVVPEVVNNLVSRFRDVPRVIVECGPKPLQVGVPRFVGKLREQAVDASNLSKAERMNLRRSHIRSCLLAYGVAIHLRTVRQTAQANCGAAMWSVLFGDKIGKTTIRG